MHMRRKAAVDLTSTDRQLFSKLPTGDVHVDSEMHLVWKYIYNNKYSSIPETWIEPLRLFDEELTRVVASLHC